MWIIIPIVVVSSVILFAVVIVPAATRSVLQAYYLQSPLPVEQAPYQVGNIVAMHGRIAMTRPAGREETPLALYYSVAMSEQTGQNISSRSHREEIAEFGFLRPGYEQIWVWVNDFPTETHGMRHNAERHWSDTISIGNVLNPTIGTQNERWLPWHEEVTVVGKLQLGENGMEIVRHWLAGLLLSPLEPSSIIRRRYIFGTIASVALVAVAIGSGLGLWHLAQLKPQPDAFERASQVEKA